MPAGWAVGFALCVINDVADDGIMSADCDLTWTDGVGPAPIAATSGRVDSPYRGLCAFDERDAAFFFGRETATARILRRMSDCLGGSALLVVSGASGVGKSSLLRAGVLPSLRAAGLASAPQAAAWPCLILNPTRAPLAELCARAAVLAGADAEAMLADLQADPSGFALVARQAAAERAGQQAEPSARTLLVVVDQFEQLFTHCTDERQRAAFVTALHAAASDGGRPGGPSALVVLAVRADFEARCADFGVLEPAVQARYMVMPLSDHQLRAAIAEPARKVGPGADGAVLDAAIRDVHAYRPPPAAAGGVGQAYRASALPLLSHALDQAWRARAGPVLGLADYERAGRLEGAVTLSAQRAYDRLTRPQQEAARQVFVRLTATSQDGADLADRAGIEELLDADGRSDRGDVRAVLDEFAAERLLTL